MCIKSLLTFILITFSFFSFFSACDSNHWGVDCVNTCTCSINTVSCNSVNGTCMCKDGWEGTKCETDKDECKLDTKVCNSITNSVCKNTEGAYTCECKPGYKKNNKNKCEGKHFLKFHKPILIPILDCFSIL